MAKKIILTEEQLKRISSLINEEFDSHIYDLVLDIYNEYGLDGMADDEIAYLKSGGETEIPFSLREPEKNYNLGLGNRDSDEETQIRELSEILDGRLFENKRSDTHLAIFLDFEQPVYDEIVRIFGGTETEDNLGNYIKVLSKDGKIVVVIPLSWEDKLFGEDVK
jgi:hypothetical protein